MKKQFLFLLSVVTVILTSCENYSSTTNNTTPSNPNHNTEPRRENPGQPTGPRYQDTNRNNP